ncbi:MAG: hypothetical protein ACJ8H8_24510, partial [Geminicoccaceae bacterium]
AAATRAMAPGSAALKERFMRRSPAEGLVNGRAAFRAFARPEFKQRGATIFRVRGNFEIGRKATGVPGLQGTNVDRDRAVGREHL